MEKREMKDLEIKEDHPVQEKKAQPDEVVAVELSPEEQIRKMQEELSEAKEKYLRLYAEFENYRKRVQKDREELVKYSIEPLVMELLTVIDNLEMALEHSENDATAESLIEGVELTLREFRKVIGKYGVQEIESLGKPFDPAYHHAINQVQRNDVESNTVVEEYRKGYLLKDRVIRPSLVAVSRREGEAGDVPDVETMEVNDEDTNNNIKED
ncbi:MAG TPA: nucleotide exchange factor GrpE [Nitrospirae bacterium]|nr:heat shock protein GrpE [bacterium BMS3Abin08]HDO35061.1 nucleotide exchange factor GrpE [Nitrospirota bacterium]HDY72068.1 nucleotide exchange factor GrpE [Nitrospirota bacterium]